MLAKVHLRMIVTKAHEVRLAIARDIHDKTWMLLHTPARVVRTEIRHILRRRAYESFPMVWAVPT